MDFELPKIIAHRGASAYKPENTIIAFQNAKELGATWVEFDVMLSADGEAITIHDVMLDRTTSGQGNVADHTYDEISQLDAGRWFAPEFAGEKSTNFC